MFLSLIVRFIKNSTIIIFVFCALNFTTYSKYFTVCTRSRSIAHICICIINLFNIYLQK